MLMELNENRSNTIEIIGPPGIGKSMLFQEVCKLWNPKKNWIYDDILLAPKKPNLFQLFNWIEYKYRWVRGKKMSKNLPNSLGEKFILKNQNLANFCWNYLSEDPTHSALRNRYRYTCFLFDNFCKYQAIIEKNSVVPCLIEEGFLQKSFLIHEDRLLMEKIVDQYMGLLPLPSSLIVLDTEDTDLIVKRIKQRKKIIPSHYNMDDSGLLKETKKWQYFLDLVLDKMSNRNVPVYKIDGSRPLGENVSSLNIILQSHIN